MTYLISILIPTLIERRQTYDFMVEKLYRQIEGNDNLKGKVEILSICDDRSIPLSMKRNMLQKMSSGKYFTHLDDDDNFTDDYCKTIVEHIESLDEDYDIISYDQKAFLPDNVVILVKPSMNCGMNLSQAQDPQAFHRFPWQWSLWNEKYKRIYRTDSDTNQREDQNWLKKIMLEYPATMSYITDFVGHEYHFEEGVEASTCQ
jgi:hypothetical protein